LRAPLAKISLTIAMVLTTRNRLLMAAIRLAPLFPQSGGATEWTAITLSAITAATDVKHGVLSNAA
jgi:hypothetical protein